VGGAASLTQPPAAELLPPDCWDAAFDVARRFRDFDSYGSEAKAIRALRRRCPGISREQADELFHAGCGLWQEALEAVAANADALWREYRSGGGVDPALLDREHQRRCPEVPVMTWRTAVGWIWFWHHLK